MSTFTRIASVGAVVRAVRMAVRPGGPSLGERAGAVPRLVRATVAGQYQGTSVGRLVLMLAAAGYVVSPVDLMPEGLLGVFGLADDAMVLSWLATRLVEETEQFLEWEREQGAMPPTAGPDGSASRTTPSQAPGSAAASQTVPGDVVR
ncbi:MAG TPA: YkvA family protein [Blastococcus sp.]|nr:YkvA family protein [Blastococcus sp.]